MENKMVFASVYIYKGKAVIKSETNEYTEINQAVHTAVEYANSGVDGLFLFDLSDNDQDHEIFIGCIKEAAEKMNIPIMAGGNIKRLEDVKKILYAGAAKAILDSSKEDNMNLAAEASSRFGKEKTALIIDDYETIEREWERITGKISTIIVSAPGEFDVISPDMDIPMISIVKDDKKEAMISVLKRKEISGIGIEGKSSLDFDFMNLKYQCKELGIQMNVFESSISFKEFKLNGDGLIPVIVQDYKTDQVLMLAYMNEASFEHTLKSGKMTYYSRSRKEQWIKGETSGHYQYVKGLFLDCDNDTILAKVIQIGAACHTGSTSCFYKTLVKKDDRETNPLKVFEDVYGVIKDRKENPREGSYTNYLFDKGIDKILKKLGEEATEIVIAAKNPDSEEIKYEISDFLYHMMVLMAEKKITWEDITKELANR